MPIARAQEKYINKNSVFCLLDSGCTNGSLHFVIFYCEISLLKLALVFRISSLTYFVGSVHKKLRIRVLFERV